MSGFSWATDPGAAVNEPGAGLKAAGYVSGQKFSAGHLNWLFQYVGQLDGNFDAKKGVANGFAGLDGNGKVPSSQLPSFVSSVNGDTGDVTLTAADVGAAEASHSHVIGDVTGLQTALDGKAATSHSHVIGDVTGLQTALDGKASSTHSHVATDITDFNTAADARITAQKGSALGLASLDSSGKVNTNQLPALAITNTSVVASEAAMIALTAEVGDVAVRSDLNKSFILKDSPASTAANWQELLSPTGAVSSVNGETGAVVLDYTDVGASAANHNHSGVYAPVSHSHDSLYYTKAQVDTSLSGKSNTGHTHPVTDLQTTGTRTSSAFLRGDGAWSELDSSSGLGTALTTGATVLALANNGQVIVSHAKDTTFKRLYSAHKVVPGSTLTDSSWDFDTADAAKFALSNTVHLSGQVLLDSTPARVGVSNKFVGCKINNQAQTAPRWMSVRPSGTVSARYLRLNILKFLANATLQSAGVSEIEVYDENGVKLMGIMASASSSYDSNYLPAKAIDGTASNTLVRNGWLSGYPTNAYSTSTGLATNARGFEALMLDLGSVKTISRIRFINGTIFESPGVVPGFEDFEFQFSNTSGVAAGDTGNDFRWFGADLVSGTVGGTEHVLAVNADSGTPIAAVAGATFSAGVYAASGTSTTTATSQVLADSFSSINSLAITQNEPAGTAIRYAFSWDNRVTWRVFAGGAWSPINLADIHTQGMTRSTVIGLSAANWAVQTLGDTFDLAVGLSTTDTSVTPSVDQITITATGANSWQALPIGTAAGSVQVDLYNRQTVFTNKTGGTIDLKVNVLL